MMTFYGLQMDNLVKKLQLIVALLGSRVGGGAGRGCVLLSSLDEPYEVVELTLG